ncbi:hypothetical protein D8B26_001374 [Coccidioides posadasii str. Silveira]|uniref:Plasma membrane zinc ion transporter n=5 Tax=Coccidioides TaxID=5500 RepID=E9D9Q4_COCPS|nr:ZIP Zinc transporter family protein [Coccidioides posadasii C735 delta SOWgp]EFW16635.1 plasma membrane zinc ion transporter [Coccidioides posadasii str. Silveira]KMM64601.1 membrane zinc transporter [Coccidioides posadasii RMSCC 3488]KMP01854.1 membrane zinc transporter [Coccidioides immitis RMSCC 2394]TPX25389.1 hypothetical protein DIZ76_010843 [Coccidioides immitis]EER23285.1 ZIP Zinc transporter family protein [Coccidioides posadasii C735 delta SOWgp]|eukprot:XP_003065430.1 ZIP Zinc transporter family protein [Coccidioides posadasii C735 delta SOWgp]
MNCPSRTEHDPDRPDWNQNPPVLSPDLTARQDLNGRINATQFRELSSHFSSLGFAAGADEGPEKGLDVPPGSKHRPPFADAKLPRDYYEEFCAASRQMPYRVKTLKSWFHHGLLWWLPAISMAVFSVYYMGVVLSTFRPRQKLATARVVKRAESCQTGSSKPNYSVGLHVAALAIILFVSFGACAFPMLAVRFPRLRIPHSFLFFVRHFGTGVLIATAFVHLLPTAFVSLGNPCLSQFWTVDYPAMPGAIALAAVFLVTTVEMVFSPARHICGDTRGVTQMICHQDSTPTGHQGYGATASPVEALEGGKSSDSDPHLRGDYGVRSPISRQSTAEGPEMVTGTNAVNREGAEKDVPDVHAPIVLTPEQRTRKAFLQCVLLEVGILFHSVFIGMALSVSVGNEFVILLVAISFHQCFEGLALGARISALSWNPDAKQPWLMALAYGCTTPIGQAIGLATHSLYDPDSEVGLIMVGTMNAISSGLLVYASLVELLAEDFLTDESWRILRGKRRIFACLLVFLGAFGMSLVGAWA